VSIAEFWTSWGEVARWWLPTAAVALVVVIALIALARQPGGRARTIWLVIMVLIGALAIAASGWQQSTTIEALDRESTRQRERDDRAANALSALNAKVKDLEGQVAALQEKTQSRAIDPDTAAKIADYLRPFGSQRVVVSCQPGDDEAYRYANQIANTLRAAGWDALGPETTTIFGEGVGMGVVLFVRAGASPPEGAKLLLDAFSRFNIPFQSGVSPSDAIPDAATTELFVGKKP